LEKALRSTLKNPRTALMRALMTAALVLPLGAQAQIDIVLDYSYDSGFFASAERRSALELAASDIEARLVDETFGAVTPSGVNFWELSFDNPGQSGTEVVLTNLSVAANALTIYVGGSNLGAGGPLGFANFGLGYGGTGAWMAQMEARNSSTNYEPLGGGITFNANSAIDWYFGASEAGQAFGQYDFYSVAAHEIFHILGFAQSDAFTRWVDGGFYGPETTALFGGAVPLTADGHFDQDVTFGSATPAMVPALVPGRRNAPTELDYAVLRDIGYNVTSAVPEPATWLMALVGAAALSGHRRRSV
jgi:MYXO-CTERM domain-containing protein